MFPEFDSFNPILKNFPNSISGAQLWKGEAEILNKKPEKINNNPITIPFKSKKVFKIKKSKYNNLK